MGRWGAYGAGAALVALVACAPTADVTGVPAYLNDYSKAISIARMFDARCTRLHLSETGMERVKLETFARLRAEPDAAGILSRLEAAAAAPDAAARAEASYQGYLTEKGLDETDGQAFCRAGEQEVAAQTLIGRMIVKR